MEKKHTYHGNMITINRIGFLKDMLIQWRAILCVGIIVGILVSAVQYKLANMKYYTDLAAYNAAVEAQKTTSTGELDEEATDPYILELHETLPQLEESLKETVDYRDNSLLLKMDPNNVRKVVQNYSIRVGGGIPATGVFSEVQTYLLSEESANRIVEDLKLDTKASYVSELIDIKDSGNTGLSTPEEGYLTTVMSVSFMVPNGVEDEDIEAEFEKLVDDYVKNASTSNLDVSIELLNQSVTVGRDSIVSSAAYNNASTINSLNSLKTSMKSAIKTAIDNGEFSESVVEPMKPTAPGFDVKSFFAGLVLGIIIYLLLALLLSLFGRKVDAACNAGASELLGRIAGDQDKKGIMMSLLYDKNVYRRVNRNQLLDENHIRELLYDICARISDGEKKLQIVSVDYDFEETEVYHLLQEEAEKIGMNINLISASDSWSKDLYDSVNSGVPALILVKEKKSTKKNVNAMEARFNNAKSELLGRVLVA